MIDALIETWTVQLRKGILELIILAALAEKERYGFELIGTLRDDTALEMPEGTIYPLLTRLAGDRLIAAEWRDSGSGPPRKYYRLSDRGRQALERMVDGWRQLAGSVSAMIGEGNYAVQR